jgi:hypothetical protein
MALLVTAFFLGVEVKVLRHVAHSFEGCLTGKRVVFIDYS